jgi:hypothetical protein
MRASRGIVDLDACVVAIELGVGVGRGAVKSAWSVSCHEWKLGYSLDHLERGKPKTLTIPALGLADAKTRGVYEGRKASIDVAKVKEMGAQSLEPSFVALSDAAPGPHMLAFGKRETLLPHDLRGCGGVRHC